jgi:hypothetical protein
MTADQRTLYQFAMLRVVPHPHLAAFTNVGVMLHARTIEYLGLRVLADPEALRRLVPDLDPQLLVRYLRWIQGICDGDPAAGPVALLPSSERFHWLTAPRSDVLQASPVHEGVCEDPEVTLERLYSDVVRVPPS